MAEEPGNIGTVLRPIPFGIDPDPAATATAATEAVAVAAAAALTDTQLRATAVPVNVAGGTVNVIGSITAVGPLTNTQLRASAVPVSGTVTASGPLTNAELRATPVPVSGTVATGGLTDAQLRASAVPVSAAVLPLPAGAATEATLVALTGIAPIANPYFQSQLTGLINGRVTRVFNIKGRRAGFNAINTFQDIAEWLGLTIDLLPELTGVENFEVVSSNAADTAAGTGARTVRVVYINTSNVLVQSAAITLNGVTPVAAGFNANYILWMIVETGGTSEGAAGNILLRIAGAGATHEQVSIGQNRSASSRFMVPTGHTAYVSYWQVTAIGGATQDARLRAQANPFDRSLLSRYLIMDNCFVDATGGGVTNEIPWLRFPALSKIKASTIPSGTAASNRVDSNYSVLLVAD